MGRIEIGSTLGNYRILAPLGAGGMGEVYRARDNTLRREVALKVLPETLAENAVALERFQREAQLLASVTHPNIATIHGLHEDAGIRFLTMELVEGLTLTDRMAARGLERDAALRTAAQIARALEAAHGRGIVHRDLKPGNVMITSNGDVKILDFGLAKAFDLPGAATGDDALTEVLTLTTEGAALGTVPYMSPEQVRGEAVDARCDIWAFACVLFEMLSGKRTFERTSMLDTAAAVLERDPPWEQLPQDVPQTIRTLLVRCLQKDPQRRLHAIADARIEIEDSLGTTSASFVDRGGLRPLGAPPSTLNYLDSVGDYVVVEKLGAGAFGEVYRAWDRVRERDVALKVLKPEAVGDSAGRNRLQQEAAALSDVQHPNIAALVEFGSHDGLDFLARELVVGEPLTTRLAKGPLSQTEALPILRQVGAALVAAHGSGVVHRDLKAGNILVTPDGVVKLVDFGLARTIDPTAAPPTTDSTTGKSSGPLQYCPPEVLRGAAPNDRSDLYTLGVVAYQMLTGLRPFQATNAEELKRAIRDDAPRPLREVRVGISAAAERLVLGWLSKDPSARGTVPEALEALDALRTSTSVSGMALLPSNVTAVGQPGAATPSRRRLLPWAVAAVSIVAIAIAGVAWWVSSQDGEGPLATAPAVIDSLIVIPATVQATDDSDAFLADALPALLTGYLGEMDGLETKVPPSSVDYAKVDGDLRKIGELYGVSALLAPTVTIQGDRFGLTLQLLRPDDGGVLWGQVYEGTRDGFFALARTAADDVRHALRPGSGQLTTRSSATPISDSDLALQRGLHYSSVYRNRLRQADLDRALVELEEALRLDATNARAAASLAMLHLSRMASGAPVLEVAPEMKRWADRALELDPRSSSAWAVLSTLEPGRDLDSYRRKLEYALKAAAFGPRNGYAHTCLSAALSTNSNELALAATREAARIEPLRQTGILYEAIALITVEEIEAGLSRIDAALDNEPDQPFALMTRALVLARAGRPEEGVAEAAALERFVQERRLHPAWVAYARDYTGYIAAVARGEHGATATNEMLERLMSAARGDTPFPRWENITRGVSNLLARVGESEAAIDLLRARHDKGIRDTLDFLMFHSDLASIRDDDRVVRITSGAEDRFDTMVEILSDARERAEYPGYLEQPMADLLGRVRAARGSS